jgi:hypothetical protein|tara:strand:- start:674 stop:1048 length:375 start_codon:yes stop_codon:yes gene_type:complete
MSDDYDFGFTIVDEDELGVGSTTSQPVQAEVSSDQMDAIMDKLEQLESRILTADNSGMINEHRALVEQDVAGKLRDVEDLILPLLLNLKKNPEKDYIKWANRTVIIDKQIEKIKAITRYFERLS